MAMKKGCHDVGLRKQHLGYQHLGRLVFHIVGMVLGIVLCWCWQCLLTFGGNLLPHIATPLDVSTVAWCCRQTKDVLHPAECPPGTLQTSEWQWTASVFTTLHYTGSCCSFFIADKCLHPSLISCFGCLTGVNDTCVRWYCASCWISSVPCQSVLHFAGFFKIIWVNYVFHILHFTSLHYLKTWM